MAEPTLKCPKCDIYRIVIKRTRGAVVNTDESASPVIVYYCEKCEVVLGVIPG